MFNRSALLAALLAAPLAAPLAATPALAQGDPAAMGRLSAANQLGVLEFCQSHGDVGQDAVSAQQDVITRMPPSAASTASAESLGKQGTFAAPNGQQITLADMATKQNTTASALCKQMGSSTLQMAAAFKQNGPGTGLMPATPSNLTAIPGLPAGMPAMPGGMPLMPTMPSGPGMTAVPGLPTPGIPGR